MVDKLNTPQQLAVDTLKGPVLMLAGAGTGKTKALTARIANLVDHGVSPDNILAVTFTNKAAFEMKNRVADLIDIPTGYLNWMGTFHSICAKILRIHAEHVGLTSKFSIIDTSDSLRIMKQILESFNIDIKEHTPKEMISLIDEWKNDGITPDNFPQNQMFKFNGWGSGIYKQYQERLIELNAVDFGDLILHVVEIFKTYAILEKYTAMFKYVLVDEYQDTNAIQYTWLKMISSHENICCVGDDDQSIYGWRGAKVENILKFDQDFPSAKIIKLEQNYRSTPKILDAAHSLIQHNTARLPKQLWTENNDQTPVKVIQYKTGIKESHGIIKQIQHAQCAYNDMAVLVRAAHQMRIIEERMVKEEIPYRIIGGAKFYDRMEIKDAISYIKLVTNPSDDLAFWRALYSPRRGVGKATEAQIEKYATDHNKSAFAATVDLIRTNQLNKKPLVKFIGDVLLWVKTLENGSHVDVSVIALDEYINHWRKMKTVDSDTRVENLVELLKAIAEFKSFDDFLEHVSLVSDIDQDETDQVNMMTIHASKGLEFHSVFLPGWEEGILPSLRDSKLKSIEEERRLGYVAITRAKRRCYISYAATRFMFGQFKTQRPSRFIEELDENTVVNVINP